MDKYKILVMDDDTDILAFLEETLKDQYEVVSASDGSEGLLKLKEMVPDLVITDYSMPVMTGPELCKEMRKDFTLSTIPVIMLTGMSEVRDMVSGIDSGADDYLIKPIDPDNLLARVGMILKRTSRNLDANPLTRLPGNTSIMEELQIRIKSGRNFAVGYCDLDKFKIYNDKYGFEKGDEILKLTAKLLVSAVQEIGQEGSFVGHIGGDDFIFISDDNVADQISRRMIDLFDFASPGFYSEEDRLKGYILGKDRSGQETKAALISISIGIVSNVQNKINHVAQIGEIAAELKKIAKEKGRSNYVRDRRQE